MIQMVQVPVSDQKPGLVCVSVINLVEQQKKQWPSQIAGCLGRKVVVPVQISLHW